MLIGFHLADIFICIVPFIVLPALGFWIWMLIDCARTEPPQGNNKRVWMLVILLTNCIGALIYCFVRRPVRIRITGH